MRRTGRALTTWALAGLTGADLRGADPRGARLGGAGVGDNLEDEATRWPDGFSRATRE